MRVCTRACAHTHTWTEECGLFLMWDTELFQIGNKTIKLAFLKDFHGSNMEAALQGCKIANQNCR